MYIDFLRRRRNTACRRCCLARGPPPNLIGRSKSESTGALRRRRFCRTVETAAPGDFCKLFYRANAGPGSQLTKPPQFHTNKQLHAHQMQRLGHERSEGRAAQRSRPAAGCTRVGRRGFVPGSRLNPGADREGFLGNAVFGVGPSPYAVTGFPEGAAATGPSRG